MNMSEEVIWTLIYMIPLILIVSGLSIWVIYERVYFLGSGWSSFSTHISSSRALTKKMERGACDKSRA